MLRYFILHGAWIPQYSGQLFKLAIHPIIQRVAMYGNQISSEGTFSIVPLEDDLSLDKALTREYLNAYRQAIQTPNSVSHENSYQAHQLGEVNDPETGLSYNVLLLCPNSVTNPINWNGLFLLNDIDLEEDETMDIEIVNKLKYLEGIRSV